MLYICSQREGEDSVWDYVQERNLLHLERTSWLKYFKELTTLVHKYGRPPNMIDDFDDTHSVHVRSFYAWQYLHVLVGRGDFSDERTEEVEERTKELPKKRFFDPHTRKWSEHQYEQDMAEVAELLRENVIRAGANVNLLTSSGTSSIHWGHRVLQLRVPLCWTSQRSAATRRPFAPSLLAAGPPNPSLGAMPSAQRRFSTSLSPLAPAACLSGPKFVPARKRRGKRKNTMGRHASCLEPSLPRSVSNCKKGHVNGKKRSCRKYLLAN